MITSLSFLPWNRVSPNPRLVDTRRDADRVQTLAQPGLRREKTGVQFRVAATPDERIAAFRLVYRRYRSAGLISPNRRELHITTHQLSSGTTIFLGHRRGKAVCTLSLVADHAMGLPMEDIFAPEIIQRRNRGLILGEVSCLAVDGARPRQFLPMLVGLTRLMAQFARQHGMDQLVIAAHPKHAKFYEHYMGFRRFGSVRAYPKVCNRPAVASCLDFEVIDRDRPACWSKYFAEPIPSSSLQPKSMSEHEKELYQQIVDLNQLQLQEAG